MSWDAAEVKRQVRDWTNVLVSVAGIPRSSLDGRGHSCPRCHGQDRFSLIDKKRGAVICRHCFDHANGDGFAAIQHYKGVDFVTAIRLVAEYLGLKEESNGKPERAERRYIGSRRRLAARGVTADPEPLEYEDGWLTAVGGRKEGDCWTVPMYDEAFEQCSQLSIWPDHKLNAKDKPAGIFAPHKSGKPVFPHPGEEWLICEGAKDCSVLLRLGYRAIGLSGNTLQDKHVAMFTGCDMTIVPDNDKPGRDGAARTAAKLRGVARRVYIVGTYGEEGQDARDVLKTPGGDARIRRAIAEAKAPEGEKPGLRTYSWDRLMSAPEKLDYVVDRVLVRNEYGMICGPEKCLKSSLAMALGISVASGTKFLGEFEVLRSMRVGLISAESNENVLGSLARRIRDAQGIPDEAVRGRLFVSDEVCRLVDPEDNARLRKWIEDHQLQGGLLIAEPAYVLIPMDSEASNYIAVNSKLTYLTQVARDYNLTALIATHSKKLNHFRPLNMKDVSFAGFSAWCRQWWLLNRRVEFDERGPDGRHELWLRTGGAAGFWGLHALDVAEGRHDTNTRRWEVELRPGEEIRVEEEQDKTRKNMAKVLRVMIKHGEWASRTKIAELAKMAYGDVKEAVELADELGLAESRKGDPNRTKSQVLEYRAREKQ